MDEFAEIFLRGEIDVASADKLLTQLRARALVRDGPLVVDCMDLVFIDAAGLHAIETVHKELLGERRRLKLVNPGPLLARILDICGLNDLLDERHRATPRVVIGDHADDAHRAYSSRCAPFAEKRHGD